MSTQAELKQLYRAVRSGIFEVQSSEAGIVIAGNGSEV
jgi:hypothetical protein